MMPTTQNPFSDTFRGYHELQDWLREGETMIEMHGTRIRLSMVQSDGRVRFCEAVVSPDVPDWKFLVNNIAHCYYDLHKRDFEIQ